MLETKHTFKEIISLLEAFSWNKWSGIVINTMI